MAFLAAHAPTSVFEFDHRFQSVHTNHPAVLYPGTKIWPSHLWGEFTSTQIAVGLLPVVVVVVVVVIVATMRFAPHVDISVGSPTQGHAFRQNPSYPIVGFLLSL